MKEYNIDYINEFEEKNYQLALCNTSFQDKLIEQYINRYNDTIKINSINILFKESLDHYILKKLVDDPKYIDSKEMINYVNYILKIYKVDNIEFNTNVVFRNTKTRNLIIDKFFSNEEKLINSRFNKIERDYEIIIEKIRTNQFIRQDELEFISKILSQFKINNLPDNEELLKYIFSEKSRNNYKMTYPILDFVLSKMPFVYSKGSVKNVRCVIADIDRKEKINGPGHSSGKGKYVAVNKSFFKNINLKSIDDSKVERKRLGSDISFFLIFIFHELTHQVQLKKSKSGFLDDLGISYIIRNVLNSKFKDYKRNHDSDSIEIDANKYGWKETELFADKYFDGIQRKILKTNSYTNYKASETRRLFSFKQDENKEFIPYEEYDIKKLVEIIKNNVTYLDTYPMLNKIFNKNGSLKLEFLYTKDLYTDANLMEFVNYFFKSNSVENLEKHLENIKINDDYIIHLVNNLYYYVIHELDSYNDLNYVMKHNSFGEYKNTNNLNEKEAYKIIKRRYKYALNAYKQTLTIFSKIKKIYPQSINLVDDFIIRMNKYFDDINNINLNIENKHI